MLVLRLERVDAVENNKLDIVVGLLDDQIDKSRCGCFHSCGVLGKNGKRGGGFVLDDIRGAVEKLEDGADVA